MIEIICNEENSDKSKQVTRGAAIRRPKNIKQIGEVSSDKKIYIEDYVFTYINSIAYNNPSDSQAGVLLGESQTDGNEKCVFIKGIINWGQKLKKRECTSMKMYGTEYIRMWKNIFRICQW